MYRNLRRTIFERIQDILKTKYGVEIAQLTVEQPPKIELGEFALPVAFELAKRLKKAPHAIAKEIQAELSGLDGVASIEIAGAGYLNIKMDRARLAREIAHQDKGVLLGTTYNLPGVDQTYYLVEHTSINPNKAAHIGHLRNAILGDTFVRILRARGGNVGVQNYIDNTGVQVADVVVGLTALEGKNLASVRELLDYLLDVKGEPVDYYCWDLYARVSKWYEEDPEKIAERKKLRLDTLHELEAGGNETSEIAELVSMAVLKRHLETMERLGIEYDFLPRESEILHLKFWETAFALMKEKGVLYLETEGKNKGCWVMKRATASTGNAEAEPAEESVGPDEDAKIIVRSNGTVTYVGKDIAYHLWKFGLLGKKFKTQDFYTYPDKKKCLISAMQGQEDHFGNANVICNVIDSRQNDPQNNVILALRGMGYVEAADNYVHLNYEMVALTPRCALELGYPISEEDRTRSYIEVSGRKGFGVKADDLLDKMIAAAHLKAELDVRNPDMQESEKLETARRIAIGALRYFMLKFTRNSVIAFDFDDALSFEGETGPYVQYAVVRAANIFRKASVAEADALEWMNSNNARATAEKEFSAPDGDVLWELWLTASRLSLVLEYSALTAEPAHLAKYTFQLAQQFHNFYHRYHILNETDEARKALLLASAAVAKRELTRALGWMGIQAPDVM